MASGSRATQHYVAHPTLRGFVSVPMNVRNDYARIPIAARNSV
jgi:hypothetical protein